MVAVAAIAVDAQAGYEKGASPAEVSVKMTEQLFRTKPEAYKPIGCDTDRPSYGAGKMMYCVVATWVNAMECARLTSNQALEKRLVELYRNTCAPGAKTIPLPDGVENSLYGALPLEIAIRTQDKESLALGLSFANAQWEQPIADVHRTYATPPEPVLAEYVKNGFSPQTRLRIDDVYMITALQVQAYRATKDQKYLDRAARQMCLYVDRLQRKDGLFVHSIEVPIVWGRGAGWMAGGLTLLLKELPGNHPDRKFLMNALVKFAEGLETWQRAKTGLWGQIVDDPESWDESSASAMFASMLVTGASRDWIPWGYMAKGRRAYDALVKKLDQYGNIADVCDGTNATNDRGYYMKRPKVNGAPCGQAAMLLLSAALMEEDSPLDPWGRKKKWRKESRQQPTLKERAEGASAAKEGQLKLESTYECISVAWGAHAQYADVKMEYRKAGEGRWNEALTPLYFRPGKNYRGSIVHLAEDTDYEVRILVDDQEQIRGKVRTWKTDVPIAKTVAIDTQNVKFPMVIDAQGAPDGWIRYVPKDGKELVNETTEDTIHIQNAKCVLLEGFKIRGGKGVSSVRLDECWGVRIRDCEIYQFGPAGKANWKQRGYCVEDGLGEQSGAILLRYRPHEVTIERCLIHSPRGRAHSWRYSHPYGPAAIQYWKPDSLVIRWCDFIGSDTHRFEDCVKSTQNGGLDTGPNRNADILGNFFFCANDDGIELDGGQQNVRCYRNRFEEALMGCSIQYNTTSPSYVFENAFTGLGTEFGHMVSAVKTSSIDGFHFGSASFVFNNTFCGPGTPLNGALDMSSNCWTARLDVRNNLFVGVGQELLGTNFLPHGRCENNFYTTNKLQIVDADGANVAPNVSTKASIIPNFAEPPGGRQPIAGALQVRSPYGPLPYRPIPWTLSHYRAGGVTVQKGVVTPTKYSRFQANCPAGTDYKHAFKVCKTVADSDWYEVVPSEGVMESGKTVQFEIKYDPAKMMDRRKHAAAFVVRTDDCYSRPFTIHATTDREEPYKCDRPGDKAFYAQRNGNVFTFDLPAKGEYYVLVRGKCATADGASFFPKGTTIVTKFDDKDEPPAQLHLRKWSTWAPYTPGTYNLQGFEREAGKHTIEIISADSGVEIEGMVMTDNPGLFEPEGANGAKVME